jgi:hypothetical protein
MGRVSKGESEGMVGDGKKELDTRFSVVVSYNT